jgi:hypothetical protein
MFSSPTTVTAAARKMAACSSVSEFMVVAGQGGRLREVLLDGMHATCCEASSVRWQCAWLGGHPREVPLDHTYASFNPSNMNHELCHHTDKVTRMLTSTLASNMHVSQQHHRHYLHHLHRQHRACIPTALLPCNTLTMHSATALMASHNMHASHSRSYSHKPKAPYLGLRIHRGWVPIVNIIEDYSGGCTHGLQFSQRCVAGFTVSATVAVAPTTFSVATR